MTSHSLRSSRFLYKSVVSLSVRSVQQLRGKDVRPLAELAAPMCDAAACAPPPPPRFSVIGRKCRFSPEYLSLPVCSIFLRILRGTWINPTVAGNAVLHARKRRYKSCLIIREHGARRAAGNCGFSATKPLLIPATDAPIESIGGAHYESL